MNTLFHYILVMLFASLAVGAGLLLSSYMGQAAPEEETAEYTNTVYGYTVTYPTHLKIQEYSPDIVSFATITDEFVDSAAEIRVMTIEGMPEETFEEAVVRSLSNMCAADGSTESFSCTGLEISELFNTSSDEQGVKLYLSGQLVDLTTGATTTVSKGPYFVFLLGSSATMSRILVIEPPLNKTAAEVEASTIELIAKSIVLPQETTNEAIGVEEYVRKNINDLSPKNPELGGTFFVTEIETAGGMGTVWYEDGHIALVADFTYVAEETGAARITSFVLRE
ncbi:hypothetical protein C4585_02230 [Candidatus Parcubacteria bacterium]|nr:MAG: hypothetical protein C4585_02230 [Candidatus Parcubacteria bacterium]